MREIVSTFPEKEYDNIIIVPDESMDIEGVYRSDALSVRCVKNA